jgi:hypothetical protein
MTIAARAATSDELTYLNAPGQWSRLYLAIKKPATVLACQVSAVPLTSDDVTEISYDTVTAGAYTDVLPGMSLYIGTSAGAYDKGILRVRDSCTSTKILVGRTSEVDWALDDYLTVVDDIRVAPRHRFIPNNLTMYMDAAVEYSNQHKYPAPVPVLGPDLVLWYSGVLGGANTISYQRSDSDSWVPGSTISSRAWTAPSGTVTNPTTATPTITYNSASGMAGFRVSDVVTAANGASSRGIRYDFVFDDTHLPIQSFRLESCQGDWDSGYWTAQVTLYDEAALADVVDQAKIIIFARDFLGSVESQAPGMISTAKNIIFEGWVDGESVTWATDLQSVSFSVYGPGYWLSKIQGYPFGIKDVYGSDPTSWLFMRDLTVDKALWHFLHWESTITQIIDVQLSGDTRLASALESTQSDLWQQLSGISYQKIFAKPLCDRFGRLFIEIDTQMIPSASRTSIPIVMDIQSSHWFNQLDITRVQVRPVARLELSGVKYASGTGTGYFSRAPGTIFTRTGRLEIIENLVLTDQPDCNSLCGLLMGWKNNEYPNVRISLASDNRLIDIAPRQRVTITATIPVRNITWAAKKFLPRRVSLIHDPETGVLHTELEVEGETVATLSRTYVPPPVAPVKIPKTPGITPIVGPPAYPGPFPFPPPNWLDPGDTCKTANPGSVNGPHPLIFTPLIIPSGESATTVYPCWIRQDNSYGKTQVVFNVRYDGVSLPTYVFAALDADGDVALSPSVESVTAGVLTYTFAPVSGLTVNGFKLTATAPPEEGEGILTYVSKGEQDASWPLTDPPTHSTAPANVSYVGNGIIECQDTTRDDFHYWVAFLLHYEGGALPSGHMHLTITNISGDMTDEWDGSHGFHSGATRDDALPLTSDLEGTGPTPRFGTAVRDIGPAGNWIPGTAFDIYIIINLGFHAILETCQFRIDAIDWIVDNVFHTNLYPTGFSAPRRVYIDKANIYNICTP